MDAHSLGLALLHSLWQGGLIALVVYLALEVTPRSSLRYIIALAGLSLFPVVLLATSLELTTNRAGSTFLLAPTTTVVPPLTQLATPPQQAVFGLLPYLTYLWLLGVLLYGLGLVGGVRRVQYLKRRGQPCDRCLGFQLEALKNKLGVRGQVELLESAWVRVPTVIGWLKPVILLPPAVLTGLTTGQLEAILLHELAHIKRRDYLVNLLQTLVETLFFYHPAARWLSKQVRLERENCCDDLVVRITHDPLTYARALTLLETQRSHTLIPLAASGGQLMNRIRRLTQQPHSQQPRPQPTSRLFLLGALLLGLLAACATTVNRADQNSTSVNDYQRVCLEATVAMGKHVMPAFNAASMNAMSTALAGTPWEVSSRCDDTTVRLDYAMTFETGTLSWSANMRAVDAAGRTVSSRSATDGFNKNGAFQYTTVSTAERLLAAVTAE